MKKNLNEIVCGLVVRNMQAGSSYKQAKEQAFNRFQKEYPEMLNTYLFFFNEQTSRGQPGKIQLLRIT